MEKLQDNILTVSQLTELIRTLLEGSFSFVQIKGEISNFRPSAQGHLYFSLKDNDAQISAVMFRGSAASLKFKPKDGMLVQAKGKISVYAQRGNYQIIITSMETAGSGAILEMLELRKRALAQEGLFDSSRKKPLPFLPKTVGIVTSSSGAALRDILQITRRRNPGMNVIVFPAVVQGETAAPSIVRMIKTANAYSMCDVLIVGRGGGSLEDLLPFSEESVVRAVAESEIPVISAVGHEIDWALCDYAADVRAPTPSAAAELAVPRLDELRENIFNCKNTIEHFILQKVTSGRLLLKTFDPSNMETQLRRIQLPLLGRYENACDSLRENIMRRIEDARLLVKNYASTLENCNPQSILDRGYSMVTDALTGKIIRNSDETKKGLVIKIKPAHGEFSARVE
ncbi:MAG: exodeoxyribonuclease VII large subunit [Treponema sp.]|nr:exodeoxyribonuclease VII large subunit [Treponema sp.]